YAVDAPAGLYVLDLAKAGPLEPVGVAQSASAPSFIELSAPSGASAPKLACLVGAGLLQLYDVSNPTAPVKISTFKTPGRPVRAPFPATAERPALIAAGPTAQRTPRCAVRVRGRTDGTPANCPSLDSTSMVPSADADE